MPTKCGSDLDPKLFDTLTIFRKEFLEKVEKKSTDVKNV